MFDAEDFIEDGYSTSQMEEELELVLFAMRGRNSKEARYLANHLESMRDECESHWPTTELS